jgi:protein Tex
MRARGWAASAHWPAFVSFATGVCVTSSIDRQIAQELAVREEQVAAAVALLDDGATVPFIARYRKEATGAT